MPAAGLVALLLAAPVVVRDPVGQGAWERNPDPVFRRVSSLLAGTPVESALVTIVPLYARMPSEAGHGIAGPVWLPRTLEGKLLVDGGKMFLRIWNPEERSVFVPAGAVFRTGKFEAIAARDAVVPAEFAALLPVTVQGRGVDGSVWKPEGVATPLAAAALLHGGVDFRTVLAGWGRLGEPSFFALQQRPDIHRRYLKLDKGVEPVSAAYADTAVGAVFLIAGRPVAAHVFATHELYRGALPDLLRGLAVQAQEVVQFDRDAAMAEPFDARGRAVAFLRNAIRVRGARGESYGEGFETISLDEADAVVGHAIIDHSHVVQHAAYLVLGAYWPNRNRGGQAGGRGGVPPRPPSGGGSETPPGVVDRKARPSLAESRQRARRPGPPNTGGAGGAGGGARGRDR
jgi:hypothetical protein